MHDMLKVVDIYGGACRYYGELPTCVVRDTCSAIHNYHPKTPFEQTEKEEPFLEEGPRFFNSTYNKSDPTMKPVANMNCNVWAEPDENYTAPTQTKDPGFTSELDLSFWLVKDSLTEIKTKE